MLVPLVGLGIIQVCMIPLLIANLAPLLGALLFGWGVADVLVAYWLETVVVGVVTLLRILSARGPDRNGKPASLGTSLSLAPFFVIHYGLFTFVHGVFVAIIVSTGGDATRLGTDGLLGMLPDTVHVAGFALAGLALAHGLDFVKTDLIDGARLRTTPAEAMFQPYTRIVVQHVMVMVGGAGFLFSGLSGSVPAILAVVAKTVVEAVMVTRTRPAVPPPLPKVD
jgi:hypothetical protein